MTNKDFWHSVQEIIENDFSDEGRAKLDEYAEWFIEGRLIYKRFSQAEQHGCIEGGTTHVIASILAGAEISPDKCTAPIGSFKREQQCGKEQEKRLKAWASKSGFWFKDTDKSISQALGDEIARGGEAHVFDNGQTLIKVIGLDYFVQPVLALDRISLHNTYFPQTRMQVIGFGENSEHEFVTIVEQPFIKGSHMTESEIFEYAGKLGYKLIDPNSWTYATRRIYLSDLHDENVIKSENGNIFVIDCDIRINTPSLKAGGTQTPLNTMEIKY